MSATSFASVLLGIALVISTASAETITPAVTVNTSAVGQAYASAKGNPLYVDKGNSGQNPMYEGSNLVAGGTFNPVGAPAYGADGSIAFLSVTGSPATTGIFTRAAGGTVLLTISGNSFGNEMGAPTLSGESVVFQESPSSNLRVLLSAPASGNIPITIVGQSYGFTEMSAPVANGAADVGFVGTIGARQGVYIVPGDGSRPVSELSLPGTADAVYGLSSGKKKKGTTTTQTFTATATFSDGRMACVGWAVFEDGAISKPVELASFTKSQTQVSVSPEGDIALCDGQTLRVVATSSYWNVALGMSDGAATAAPGEDIASISVGQTLGGAQITGLSLSPQSWDSATAVTFWASLDNNTSGLFVLTIPEPATLALLAVPLAMRRKR